MNNEILKLQPERVFYFFNEICKIPRPSGKEDKVVAWLLNLAKEWKLEAKRDERGNVLIAKPATHGKENVTPVILQGHVDMVCEKNSDKVFDFEKDSIEPYIDNGWLKAKGTTLGADDGIGVAMALAILESKEISQAVISRLPRYFRYLGELKDEGVDIIVMGTALTLSEDPKKLVDEVHQA